MFSAGTRVYIHSSSISGQKMGPKCYSVGFVSAVDNYFVVNSIREFPIKDQMFLLAQLSIAFTRYGREKRERHEMCRVTGIFPLIQTTKSANVAGPVKDIVKILEKGELGKNMWWKDAALSYAHSNIVVLALPAGCISASDMTLDQAKAWVMSIISNNIFQNILMTNRDLTTLLAAIDDKELFYWICNSTSGGSVRRDLLRWMEDSRDNVNRIVLCLRKLSSTINKRMADTGTDSIKAHIANGSKLDVQLLSIWLTANIFDNKELFNERLKWLNKVEIHPPIKDIVRHLGTVRDTLLTLRPKKI